MNDKKEITQITTAGDGLWSHKIKNVSIIDMELTYLNEEEDFGELCVFFSKKTWNIREDGLIYTDSKWINDFRNFLIKIGFSKLATESVDYSEQGMQGDDYVSLDVENPFIQEYIKK